jgi:hypothetical protein
VEFSAKGVASSTSLYNVFWDFDFENTYANGVKMIGTSKHGPRGVGFEGDKGKLFVNVHGGALEAEPANLLEKPMGSNDTAHQHHRRNFLDCVKSRQLPAANAEVGHRTATICHLNNIAMRLGRPFKWDPKTEQTTDDEANALLTPKMRAPWSIENA